LIRWSDAHPTSEARLNLGLTHEEIAQMIGASRETVTRLFAAFRKKQIVSFSNNTIVVSDRNALESMAGISTAV
jgi:CRP/FNR family transcriptional regulator